MCFKNDEKSVGFHKVLWISIPAEELLASVELCCFTKQVTSLLNIMSRNVSGLNW